MEPKADFFNRLQNLQEHLSKEIESFPSPPEPMEEDEEYFTGDYEYGFDEPEIIKTDEDELHENKEYVFETDYESSGNYLITLDIIDNFVSSTGMRDNKKNATHPTKKYW